MKWEKVFSGIRAKSGKGLAGIGVKMEKCFEGMRVKNGLSLWE